MKQPRAIKIMVIGMVCVICGLPVGPMSSAKQNDTTVSVVQMNPMPAYGPVFKLLIIAPTLFRHALLPLVRHKDAMGIPTRLVTLDEVYHQMFWYGRDDAEKVKYFIKTAIEEWGIKYVLLVGGRSSQIRETWYCPVRYVHMSDDWESEYLTDLYFADIYDSHGNFSSWDSDNDGVFGEWYPGETAQDTTIDLIPDVAVGRLPCRSLKEVRITVHNIITYETTAFHKPWFQRILIAAGDTYPASENPNWTGSEGEYYGDRAIENMSGFAPTRLYTSDGTFADKTDIIRAFRNGFGFVYLVGHGSPKGWGNHPLNNTSFVQGPNVDDMWRFNNKEKLPVCVVSGCHNSQFDVCLRRILNATTRWRLEFVTECWGERILHTMKGGAIASLGCTCLGYTKEDKQSFHGGINELETAFFHAYGQENITTLGDTWAAAISWYAHIYPVNWSTQGVSDSWIDAKVIQGWVLLGDPSLHLGGYPPQ
jgi:hypothetical protein